MDLKIFVHTSRSVKFCAKCAQTWTKFGVCGILKYPSQDNSSCAQFRWTWRKFGGCNETFYVQCRDCKDGSSYTPAEQRMNESLFCRQHILKALTVIYCSTWKLYSRVMPRTHAATFSRINCKDQLVLGSCIIGSQSISFAKACMECVRQIKTSLQQ